MIIKINGEPNECEAYSVAYPNDILDGVILDMPEMYIFLSDHVDSHRDLQGAIDDDDIEYFDMSDSDIDYSQKPHSWVVQSVGRLIVMEAESLLGQS